MPRSKPTLVSITGMGLSTSLGVDVDSTWAAIRAGRVGLGPMGAMESMLPAGSIGGQALELPRTYVPELPREARHLRWVVEQALKGAGALEAGSVASHRRCLVLGSTLHGIRAGGRFLRSDDPDHLKYFLANAIARAASAGFGLDGMSVTTCSACSSSLGAIALGITLLESGAADLVVAGGYDPVSEYAWAGFHSLRLVAPRRVMPFARNREGMMLGEGYAVVVLERAEDARRRGVTELVTIEGWGESADAHHLTQPDPTGQGAARAIGDALRRADLSARDISMIAAHATATPDNDAAEAAAFASAFAQCLAMPPVVGFKSYLGHTLGGAGAVELILSACALRTGWIPPCANVAQSEVEFGSVRVAPPGGLEGPVERTLNTSLGFGGANTCMILGHPRGTGHVLPRAEVEERKDEAWITGYGVIVPGATDPQSLRHLLDGSAPGVVRDGTVTDELLASVLNVRRMRRLGACVKLMLASVTLAVRRAGLEDEKDRLALANAILASAHGSSNFCSEYYTQIVKEGVQAANPVLFAEGVPNAAAAHVSANFGVKGACQTIIGSRTAGLDALALAALRVRMGTCEIVLVGAAEETHQSVDRAYRTAMSASSHDVHTAFRTAPGGAALIVESGRSAMARGATPIAKILGHACVAGSQPEAIGGASRACAPEFDSPTRAMRALLDQGLVPGLVLGSGNGTWIDQAESAAMVTCPSATLKPSRSGRWGDHFAAGPLLDIVMALQERVAGTVAALCTDFTGPASAIVMEASPP
jgi:3-oxoacyl-[acyl-carrier-protein] synthase II